MQAEQFVAPDAKVVVGTTQVLHVTAPCSLEYSPTLQSVHTDWPGAGWCLPTAHSSHAVKPVPFDTLPAAQFRQLEALALLYVPLMQFEQGD